MRNQPKSPRSTTDLIIAILFFSVASITNVIAATPEGQAAALKLLESKDYAAAEAAFTTILDQSPSDPSALTGRAAARRNLGKLKEAHDDVEKALAEYPENAEAYYQRARLRMKANDTKDAVKDLTTAIRLRPDHAPSFSQRAYLHTTTKNHREALADYSRAVELDPENIDFLTNRAAVHMLLGDTKSAEADYTRAIEMDPTSIWAHAWRAKVREKAGDSKGAAEDKAIAQRLKANDSDAAARLSEIRDLQKAAKADAEGDEAPLTPADSNNKATPTPKATAAASSPERTSANTAPWATVRSFIEAQGRGDAEAMLALTAQDRLSADQKQKLRDHTTRLAAKVRFEDVQLDVVAQSPAGDASMALVRFTLTCVVKSGGVAIPQSGGNLALLMQEKDGWKVYNIVADMPLSLEVFENSPPAPAARKVASTFVPTAYSPILEALRRHDPAYNGSAVRPTLAQYATPPKQEGLYDLKRVNEEFNKAVNTWRVDEGKLTRDTVGSAFGTVPIMGDVVSNAYTVWERGKTLFVELPESVSTGNVEAALLDITLIAWGGVQIVAEVVPGLDTASDAVEASIDQYRYNATQRFNYLNVMKMLQKADFKSLRKYLIMRFTQENDSARKPNHLSSRGYEDWHGKWPALKSLTFLSDEYMRRDPRVWFEVGAEIQIKKTDNETLFEAASKMGARTERTGKYDDQIVYIPLRLNALAASDASRGDAVLQDFALREDSRYIAYRLTCTRGKQQIAVRLSDGTQTQPLLIENLVFNAVENLRWQVGDKSPTDRLKIKEGEDLRDVKLVAVLSSSAGKVTAPQITGLPCFMPRVKTPQLLGLTSSGQWPSATMTLKGLAAGPAEVEVVLAKGTDTPLRNVLLKVEVEGKPKSGGKHWTLKEVRRRGLGGKQEGETKSSGGDMGASLTRTGKYTKTNEQNRPVQVSYDHTASGSWSVPSVMIPGQSVSISVNASHSSTGPAGETAVILTYPGWDAASAPPKKTGNAVGGNPFGGVPLKVLGNKSAVAVSGASASESVTLRVPSDLPAGASTSISVSLYERSVGATRMTDSANLVARRTFVYELVETK